ncbi:MAG: TetM/TetW/TetO/TetS family tetracycline resistance ribosomal protection protein [Lachnospiraceae bacterium]|nr:TetM/TetW/TetO/TetS family tetracycline resistance ribosomal protection protein [Lachnospiraceae bacterium]
MERLTLGILAHVDAGKTTLSEAILYTSGDIRKAGRVDNKDTFLDTYELERERGITIFSKQAIVNYKDMRITLLDTPGHVDFSAEMERTLQVLDAAVLVISGADGVQGHTKTLWRLLKRYQVPVFLFINKMDQPGTDKEALLKELSEKLDTGCVDFSQPDTDSFYESLAVCEEGMLNLFLEEGKIETEEIKRAIAARKVFPCFFGSALRMSGVEELLEGIRKFATVPVYSGEFGARVFKITRDAQGNRLTHMKITGGSLCARCVLSIKKASDKEEVLEEKVNQIRIYSGEKFEAVKEAPAGSVCAVTGLTGTLPGEGLGKEQEREIPVLEPVLSYCVQLPEGYDAALMLPKLLQLQEEDPMLHIVWDEELKEIHAKVMGEVQTEVLKRMIYERFGVEVSFGTGRIVYKETIADRVEGVGHFEPLRHYAEVHLLLEPGEPGSGLAFAADCSEDILGRNWQRLVLTHLEEREHRGVLTGSPITDMKITLVAGKAHQKHTEGGDFRQATYRALRQGLMEAQSVLLEPIYEFRLEVPEGAVGRAMTDMEKLHGSFTLEERSGETAVLTGTAPVVTLQDYQKEVTAYTKGHGRLFCSFKGYAPCHNAEAVMESRRYDPEADLRNPSASVFCAHGAGFVVPWNQVKNYMHLPGCMEGDRETILESAFEEELAKRRQAALSRQELLKEQGGEVFIGTEEIDAILSRTSNANSRQDGNKKKEGWQRERRSGENASTGKSSVTRVYKGQEKREEYLLVDGYNVIFAWEDLKELAAVNLDGARGKLLDILCNYQGIKKCSLIAVFDAYRLKGHPTEILDYHNIHVVYTKEAETADRYIEKFAHDNGKKYDITVATSDGLEQIIIRGEGCRLLSARDLREEIDRAQAALKEEFLDRPGKSKNYLLDGLSGEAQEQLMKLQSPVD